MTDTTDKTRTVYEGELLPPEHVSIDVMPAVRGLGGILLGAAAGIVAGYFLNEPITSALDRLTGADGDYDFEDEG